MSSAAIKSSPGAGPLGAISSPQVSPELELCGDACGAALGSTLPAPLRGAPGCSVGSLDPLRPSTPHSPLLLIPLRPSLPSAPHSPPPLTPLHPTLPSAPHSPPPLIPLCPRSPLSSPTKCLLGCSDFPPPSSLPSLPTQQPGSPWSICPARHLQASPQVTPTLTLTHRALCLPPGPHHPRCRLPLSPHPLCSSLAGLFPTSGPLHAQCPLPGVSFPRLRVVGSPGCLTAPEPPALATVPSRPHCLVSTPRVSGGPCTQL